MGAFPALGEADGDIEADGLTLELGDVDRLTLALGDFEADGETLGDAELLGLTEAEGLTL